MKTLVNEKTIDIIVDRIQDIYESEATWDEDYGIPLLSRKGYEQLEVLLAEALHYFPLLSRKGYEQLEVLLAERRRIK